MPSNARPEPLARRTISRRRASAKRVPEVIIVAAQGSATQSPAQSGRACRRLAPATPTAAFLAGPAGTTTLPDRVSAHRAQQAPSLKPTRPAHVKHVPEAASAPTRALLVGSCFNRALQARTTTRRAQRATCRALRALVARIIPCRAAQAPAHVACAVLARTQIRRAALYAQFARAARIRM